MEDNKKKKQVISGYSEKNAQLFNQALGSGLTEEAQTKAWMLRRDGKVFDVLVHPYGSEESYEETLSAAEWLYKHTKYPEVKDLIVRFITTWVYDVCDFNEATVAEQLDKEIANRPYVFLTTDFVHSIEDLLDDVDLNEDVEELNLDVVSALNNEFTRVRAGGEVNSTASLGEIYFRISSTGFNWFNIIWKFVYDRQKTIDTVTIKRDDEATGDSSYYKHGSKVFDKMPVEEFIMLKGRPLVEEFRPELLDIYIDGYGWTEEDYKEACEALRNDFHTDEDFLLAFYDYPDRELANYIKKEHGVGITSKFDEETAKEIIDDVLYQIAPLVDKDFLLSYTWSKYARKN